MVAEKRDPPARPGGRLDRVIRQRDQLREALEEIVECWDGPLYRHEMLPRIQKARAALEATKKERLG